MSHRKIRENEFVHKENPAVSAMKVSTLKNVNLHELQFLIYLYILLQLSSYTVSTAINIRRLGPTLT